MEENTRIENEKYFAAANTYKGFKSYFSEIFYPEKFDRIYVIKGGPGTGKSSLMKKAATHFCKKECKVEEIYCSSDPNSLDGIICERGEKRIALIDGTSPHETDAKIPGAIDEIINLGNHWERRWLSAKKEDILALNAEKSTAYKTAYSYLKIAGECANFILQTIKEKFDFSKAHRVISKFCPKLSVNNSECVQIRLLSSFGKYGEFKLGTLKKKADNFVSVSGDEFIALIFIEELLKHIDVLGISRTEFPLALDPSYHDAVYIPTAKVAFALDSTPDIVADEFLKSDLGYDNERIKNAKSIREIAMVEAKRWFAIASDLHFRLEDIYSHAMSFEKNDILVTEKITEIDNILEV